MAPQLSNLMLTIPPEELGKRFDLVKFLNQSQSRPPKPLSYAEFLQQRGLGQQQQAPQQSGIPDFGSLAEMFGGENLSGMMSSAPAAGEGLMSSAGANAAYNAAGMEASGAPMTLMEPVGAAQAPGAFSLSGIGGAGNAILPVAGALGAYDLFKNKRRGARGIGQGAASGAAMGSYFGPWGAGIGAVLGGTAGALQRESTRDVQKRHTAKLEGVAPNDPVYQAYVRGMREQHNSEPPDPSKPFAGKYGSWDEYKKAGLEAGDLTGVHGNIQEYGPDWAKLSFDQQKAITQANIDAGNYDSRKGEVNFVDRNKARQIFDQFKANGFNAPAGQSNAQQGGLKPAAIGGADSSWSGPLMIPQATTPQPVAKRSMTRSPGIGLDGKRIKY